MNLPPFKMILIVANFSLLLFQIMLIRHSYYSQNKNMSWASAFHLLTLTWLSIRGAFWISTVFASNTLDAWYFYALYWMANPVEFGSFMLLPLFFSQVLYPTEWKKYWKYIRIGYIGFIGSLFIFQFFWACFAAIEMTEEEHCDPALTQDQDCFHTEFSTTLFRAISAVCFIFLATLQAAYGYKLVFLNQKLVERYLISSPDKLIWGNIFLGISFLSRGLYQIYSIFGDSLLPAIPLEGGKDISFGILFIFLMWDYIPASLLVLTITSKSLGIYVRI